MSKLIEIITKDLHIIFLDLLKIINKKNVCLCEQEWVTLRFFKRVPEYI